MRYRFGPFELDVEKHELRQDGEQVSLEPQVFRLLVHLVAEHARVVTKDELIEVIWDGRFVSDSAVSSRIKSARQALGDSGKTQEYIKTIHGQGFRFVASVEPIADNTAPEAASSSQGETAPAAQMPESAPRPVVEPPSGFRLSRLSLAIVALSLLIVAAVWLRPQPSFAASDQVRFAVLPIENATGDPEHDWAEIGLMSLTLHTLHQNAGIPTVSAQAMAAASEGYDLSQSGAFVLPPDLQDKLIETRGVSHFVLARLTGQSGGFAMEFVIIDRGGGTRTGRVESDKLAILAEKASRSIAQMMPARLRFTYDSEVERDPFVAEAYARGRALQIEGKAEQARNLFGVAAEQAPEDIWLRYEYALCTRMMGDLEQAETELIALQAEAEANSDTEALVAILNGRSIIHMNRRETEEAVALLEQALPLSREQDDRTTTAVVLINLGIQSRRQGDLAKSELQLMRALAEYDAAGISSPPGSLLNSIAMVRAEQGDLAASLDYFERAEDRFELDGATRSVAAVQLNIGDIKKDLGEFEEALALLDSSLETRRELGDRRGVLTSLSSKAQLLLQLGRLDEAEDAARELLSLAEDQGDLLRQAFVHAVLGEVYATRGDPDFAVQHQRRHVSLATEAGRETLVQTASLSLARALYANGDIQGGRDTATRVLNWAKAEPSDRYEAEALATLGWFERQAGNFAAARQQYEAGLAVLEDPQRRSLKAKLSAERGLICVELEDAACMRESMEFAKSVTPVTRQILVLEAGLKALEGAPTEAASLYRQAREISGAHWTDADESRLAALGTP